ncbi:hypothetical protein G7Y79_00004g015410 [Physcia stellaris]|nr:hypothetical protein G7Y79_00004g015410 [Physcia stellaris]
MRTMNMSTLFAIGVSLCSATAVKPTTFVANVLALPFNPFDNLVGSGIAPEADPGVSLLKAPSPPNFAASVTLFQALQRSPAMITTAGTNAKSFSLTSLANACVVASQTGLVAESCTIQYNGTKAVGGGTESALCTFKADPLNPKAALCQLPNTFSGLKSVSIVPVTATLPPATTVVFIDNVGGSVSL